MHPEIIESANKFPTQSGVYIFKDDDGIHLYIGKATNLHSRIRSYLIDGADTRPLIGLLKLRATSLEFLVTNDDREALILENNLIKKFKPLYNVHLRDDKTYLSIRVSIQKEFPKLTLVRKFRKDGAKYFGPYTSASTLKTGIDAIRRQYPLRRCSDHEFRNRSRPCVYHDIKLCHAPCVGKISKEDYAEVVKKIIDFLEIRSEDLLRDMKTAMLHAAEVLSFELAATLRDQINALEFIRIRQHAHIPDFQDRDVFAIYRASDELQIFSTRYREGKLVETSSHHFRTPLPDSEIMNQFLSMFYTAAIEYPREILLPVKVDDVEILRNYVSEKAKCRISIKVPRRGQLKRLLDLATENAKAAFKDTLKQETLEEATLNALRTNLDLRNFPMKIECYDISTLMGKQTVGSQVTFVHSKPDKSQYRQYKISDENANNDFHSMAEMLGRRLRRINEENDEAPDLIVIDGGRPQLNALKDLISDTGYVGVDVVGIAKQRKKHGSIKFPERVYKPMQDKATIIEAETPENHLLKRIRDEAHRFAIEFHRKLRKKAGIKSVLDSIPGLGPKRRHKLLAHFGTVAAIKQASVEELSAIDGISPSLAKSIHSHLSKKED